MTPLDPAVLLCRRESRSVVQFTPCRSCGHLTPPSELDQSIPETCRYCREYVRALRAVQSKIRKADAKRQEHERIAAATRERLTLLRDEQLALMAKQRAFVAQRGQLPLALGKAA